MASRAPDVHVAAGTVVVLIALVAGGGGACTCSKGSSPAASTDPPAPADSAAPRVAGEPGGLSAPIAATVVGQGDVIVAGLDVPASSIRVQRISAKDEVRAERTVLEGVAWSSESDLKLLPAADGVAVTWRGLRNGKLVRQLLVLDAGLAPKGNAVEVAAASCATQDALWFTDGKRVHAHAWAAPPSQAELPKDKDASLVCGAHRAYALLDDDEGTSFLALSASPEGGAPASTPIRLLEESQFGEDDQRERSEFAVSDDFGVVRLGVSGAIAVREVRANTVGALHKLKTTLSRDADVVAVDASPRVVAVIFTEDVGQSCPADSKGASSAATRVKALRVDRTTFEESAVELAPGTCGREVGPFFTASKGEGVSVAWVERVPTLGKSRAPIAALVHRIVAPSGALGELGRFEQPADALVDAGCDKTSCYAVALARRASNDPMVPGIARVIRY